MSINCKFCGLSYDKFTVVQKIKHSKYCDLNPKKEQTLEKLRISAASIDYKKVSAGIKNAWKSGKYEDVNFIGFTGKNHSEKTRTQLSISALNSKHQRVCKSSFNYTKLDGSIVRLDSKYEERVAKILDKNNIEWVKPLPMKWIDSKGISHNYFSDFYLVKYNIYLDPKNEYCFKVQKEKINYIKENYKNVYFLHNEEINEINILHIMAP